MELKEQIIELKKKKINKNKEKQNKNKSFFKKKKKKKKNIKNKRFLVQSNKPKNLKFFCLLFHFLNKTFLVHY
jgi:hypothetical protein